MFKFKTNVKMRVSVKTRIKGNSNTLFKMAESLYTLKGSFIFLIFFIVLESNKFALAVIYWLIYRCLSVGRKWINHSHFALVIYSL